ncbi:LmbE-like protein [Nadsonia fulvescens var. elongata DSM 6958]|uniref:N-acetylglucosaminylphosphatidylinositol deacetylase n=1 Tax=Nadsonia fulvescens var. elongata DSM 6958 TaxID=857566 RepID=A0A1E3PK55_9ASCO|nr:LmbE-like protein [Nadsonia fulvescens var. elongata DSM 6958]
MILPFSLIVSLLIPILWSFSQSIINDPVPSGFRNQNITFLIAHPDDEAMFFGPILTKLSSKDLNNNITIVSISSGDFEGLGSIREQELVRSAEILGVAEAKNRVLVVNDPDLPDSMSVEWDIFKIEKVLAEHYQPTNIIITFDSKGISDHLNHKSLLPAASLWAAADSKLHRSIWTVRSIPTWRKYISYLDAFYLYLNPVKNPYGLRTYTVMSSYSQYTQTRDAMTVGHVSQMKWFRWGWITLSRYMFINDLVQVKGPIPILSMKKALKMMLEAEDKESQKQNKKQNPF